MSEHVAAHPLHLVSGLSVTLNAEPLHGDGNLDCRLLFMGDRYRELLRAYPELVFRLSRPWPISRREAFARASAEITQFYELHMVSGKVVAHLRDEVFAAQAPPDQLDLVLRASDGVRECSTPLPLHRLRAVGILLPLLNGEHARARVVSGLRTVLSEDDATWALDLIADWARLGFLTERPPARATLSVSEKPGVMLVGHTSLLFQSRQSSVLMDPLLRPSLGCAPTVFDLTRLKLGAICCTHSHWDHCDLETLLRFDKATPMIVPRVRRATAFNPPMVPALQGLGFTDIREVEPWQTTRIDDIEMVAVPFHGEQDEPGAEIDHYTYILRTDGLSLYGGVDAYRDTFGDMAPIMERVRREWVPDLAFLPVSRMTYTWRHGGVNGFCRYVDTDVLDKSFQYTAGAEQAAAWTEMLGVRWAVPYALFNFAPYHVRVQSQEFGEALRNAGLADRFLPLRPLDAISAADLASGRAFRVRRRYLQGVARSGAFARRLERRYADTLVYRLARYLLRRYGAAGSNTRHH